MIRLSTMRREPIHNWDDPDRSVLDDQRGDLPQFPMDILRPVAWQNWITRAAHGAGVRPDHLMVPLLGVTSSLIGTARRVRASPAWSEPMTVWTCVVAASGDRKTPGLRVTQRALDYIERENVDAINAARLAHEARRQNSKVAIKRYRDLRKAALDGNSPSEPPAMTIEGIDPGDFIHPRLYATDSTVERLALLLEARPRGIMLFRDELSGLFGNMHRYGGGTDRPFWLQAWNGDRYVVERVSKSIDIPHLLIGVIGGFQPDKLARAFEGDEDGMCGRFLYAWPSTPAYHPLTDEVNEVESELYRALKALIHLPAESANGVFTAQSIGLSDTALTRFEEFRQLIDETKRGLDGRERQWFVKGETQVLRLAGTLAYLAWATSLATNHRAALRILRARWSRARLTSSSCRLPSGCGTNIFGPMHVPHCDKSG
jgi:Protein of unknown function (DUF3987)